MRAEKAGSRKRAGSLPAAATILLLFLASCAGAARAVPPPELPVGSPAAIDAWLAARESAVPGLILEDQKRIAWAGAPGEVTEFSIVYIHGLQGSPRDYASVIQEVAGKLGANVYFARLKGHSVTTDEIAEATRDDWLADAREALEIGSRIGRAVIVAGSSMGGDLALWLAARGEPEPAALVLFSCAVQPREGRAEMLLWPWPFPQIFVGALIGRYWHSTFDARTYPTGNPGAWTRLYPPRYRSESFITFMDVVKLTRTLALERIRAPSLWLYSDADDAVDITALKKSFERMGGQPKRLAPVQGAHSHMLAGDIFSPETTDTVSGEILSFLTECGMLRL
jgi:alpha-beta hydrolase superfamily lysophospholipase